MIQNELVMLVQTLVNKQPDFHILDNGDYFKEKLSALFEIDHQLYNAQKDGDVVIKYVTESYEMYIGQIAKLVDEYEVRHHDLPERVLVMINDFANQLFKSGDPNIVDVEQKKEILQQAQKILHCVKCVLEIGLIEKYIGLLSHYKKALSHLDCEHIRIENVSCVRYLKRKIKNIKDGYNIINGSFKSFSEKDGNGIKYNFNNIVTISNMDKLLQDCRTLLQEIESKEGIYQKALSLGGKPSVSAKAVDVVLNYMIPGILIVISAILWIKRY